MLLRVPPSPAAAVAVVVAAAAALGVDPAPSSVDCEAATLAVPVVADTWVDEGAPATTHGSDAVLSVDAGAVNPDTGAPSGRARALLRFALPDTPPPGCVVASAKLVVFSTEEDVGARAEAVQLAAAWTESEATWTTQPATVGAAASAWSREGFMQWNVTAQVQAMLDGADHGFLIRDAAEGGQDGGEHEFDSRERNDPGRASKVVITFAAPGSGEPPGPPLPPTPAAAGCGEVLTRSTLVTNDLADCPGDGLVIGAPRIIVDLGGHTIDGTGLGAGIHNDGHADVTVRNGIVHEFDYGVLLLPETRGNVVEHLGLGLNQIAAVELFDVSASQVRDNSLVDNGVGIALVSGTRDSVVAGNSVIDSGGASLLVRDSRENQLESNSVAGGGDLGIGLERASDNVVLGNSVAGSSDGGIEVRFGSDDNRIEGNTISGSGDHGILVSESDGNELVGNAAHHLSDSGITLDAADESVVWGNDVQHNAGGLQLDGSSRNLIAANDASDTTGIGIELGGGSLANVVEGNHADDNGADGIVVADDATDTTGNPLPDAGNLLVANTADRNGADGIVVAKGGHTVTANATRGNLGWGINAALGVIDGGGNVASGNGKPAQCVGVVCSAVAPAPETFIVHAPADPTNATVAAFAFVAMGAAGFECSLDEDPFSPCDSPAHYADVAPGRHVFRVRALGAGGSSDPTPASHAWTVDTSPPATTITAAPPVSTTSTTAGFAFDATEPGSTFECSLDDAAFAACTSPRTYAGLAAGAHRFSVRAVDVAGNVDPAPATALWTIGPEPPPPPPGGGGQSDANPPDNDASLTIPAAAAPTTAPPAVVRPKAPQPTRRTGTARADVLRGTQGRDLLRGLGGRDTLYGLGGDDTLVGGTGADRLFGGAGNDTLIGRDGARDRISCGSGRDVVQADPGDRVARDCERVVRKRTRGS